MLKHNCRSGFHEAKVSCPKSLLQSRFSYVKKKKNPNFYLIFPKKKKKKIFRAIYEDQIRDKASTVPRKFDDNISSHKKLFSVSNVFSQKWKYLMAGTQKSKGIKTFFL